MARRLERRQRHVQVHRAVHRAERQPNRAGGRRNAEVDHRLCMLGDETLRRTLDSTGSPGNRSLIRKRQIRRVSQLSRRAAVEPPLHAEIAREVARRLDNARLDFYLRLRLIQLFNQLRGSLQSVRQIANDDRVCTRVDLDIAAL